MIRNNFNLNNEISAFKLSFNAEKNGNINLDDIETLYTTESKENERTTFENTYENKSIEDSKEGKKFLNGLKYNKESLCKELKISEEKYDSLACIALALASQETGMGDEEGYKSENEGIGKFIRGIAKKIDVLTGGASASSGLTQMKIYDFLNSESFPNDKKDILVNHGISATSVAKNNLYSEPDKSAIATIVVLSTIADNYTNYKNVLETSHKEISSKLNNRLTESQKIEKGLNTLNSISQIYNSASTKEKTQIRQQLKNWLLSVNDSTKKSKNVEKDYNEEIQLEKLNKSLVRINKDFSLKQTDLNYIRYALTSSGQEMNITEYCAYAWNKGTGATGMQLDRLLADKIGTILSNPEDLDYDQFTVNVSTLAKMYAEQSIKENAISTLNNAINYFGDGIEC